jgi:hypothetical protein
MLVHERQRIQVNLVKRVNQRVVQKNQERISEVTQENSIEEKKVSEQKNRGKLILDATCAPADITYPSELKILNAAREKTESIIDILHQENQTPSKKNQEPTED